jgi:hypothetical protein
VIPSGRWLLRIPYYDRLFAHKLRVNFNLAVR